MHSPRPLCVAQLSACSIAALQTASAVAQPTATASFGPNPIPEGNEGTLTLTLSNPGATPLADVGIEDQLPACLKLTSSKVTYDPVDCNVTAGGFAEAAFYYMYGFLPTKYDRARMRYFTLAAGASCSANFRVRASSFPCENITLAPTSSAGSGTAASATWNGTAPGIATFTGAGGDGNWGNPLNFSGSPLGDGVNVVFPITASTTNNTSATYNEIDIDAAGSGFSGPLKASGGVVFDVGVGTVLFNMQWTLTGNAGIQVKSGTPVFPATAQINQGSYDWRLAGPGGASMSNSWSGTGDVTVRTKGTVLVSGNSTATGAWNIAQGAVNFSGCTGCANQRLNVFNTGVAILPSAPPYPKDINVSKYGVLKPVGTVSISGTTTLGSVISDMGTNNIVFGRILSTNTVMVNSGSSVQFNLNTMPNVNDTFNFISSTSTVSGRFGEAFTNKPNVRMVLEYTAHSVTGRVVAIDDIFGAGNDSPPFTAHPCGTEGNCH